MHHLRSASEGCSRPRCSIWDTNINTNTNTAAAPELAHVYARKPLPPLPQSAVLPSPVPQPLSIRKKSAAAAWPFPVPQPPPSGLRDLRDGARSASPRPIPNTPTSASHPRRYSSRASPVAVGQRSSRKVLQLMGHDVGPRTWNSDNETHSKMDSSFRSSPRFLDVSASDPSLDRRSPEESLVPLLEADMDGMSSRNSSWAPSSPLSAAMIPTTTYQPIIRQSRGSSSGECESPSCSSLHDDSLSSRWDPSYGHFSDTMAAGEYHKFAVELAASNGRKDDTILPLDTKAKGRSSPFPGFSTNAQFSRRRNRPHSIDPAARSNGGSQVEKTPLPEQPPPASSEVQATRVLRSAFDSDSDDERGGRSRWAKERLAHKSEERGRDSPTIYAMMRRNEESSRSRGWSRTGDQMKELLASAKDRARGLPAPKGERRREQLRRDIKVLPEGDAA